MQTTALENLEETENISETNMRRPNLANAWQKASEGLKLVRGRYGDAGKKEACAIGAIAYYVSGGKTCDLDIIEEWAANNGEESMLRIYSFLGDEFQRVTGKRVVTLNDKEGWTFEQFAEKARDLRL